MGTPVPVAIWDSSRSSRKMMSSGGPSDVRGSTVGLWHAPGGQRRRVTRSRAAAAAGGTIDDTSPPKLAISFTSDELT